MNRPEDSPFIKVFRPLIRLLLERFRNPQPFVSRLIRQTAASQRPLLVLNMGCNLLLAFSEALTFKVIFKAATLLNSHSTPLQSSGTDLLAPAGTLLSNLMRGQQAAPALGRSLTSVHELGTVWKRPFSGLVRSAMSGAYPAGAASPSAQSEL